MHQLAITLGTKADLHWAQQTVTAHHCLHQPVHNQARPMVYVLTINGLRAGLMMVGLPHATKNRGWWGYDGLPTQWQVVDLCRIWIAPELQPGGYWASRRRVPGFTDRRGIFRPTVATWFIHEVLARVQRDRVSLWPPVYLDKPYHIRLVISYHDPALHRGTIYKLAGAEPMYTDEAGTAVPGPSGKYGWCWRLPEPDWNWNEIDIAGPRTLRLPLEV
jgi:hypothetical protein